MKYQTSIVLSETFLNAEGTAAGSQPFFFLIMKKLTVFIIILLLLIVSEYFLLNELFSRSIRVSILLLSLVGTVIFVFAVVRFFKKYILPTKHHS